MRLLSPNDSRTFSVPPLGTFIFVEDPMDIFSHKGQLTIMNDINFSLGVGKLKSVAPILIRRYNNTAFLGV